MGTLSSKLISCALSFCLLLHAGRARAATDGYYIQNGGTLTQVKQGDPSTVTAEEWQIRLYKKGESTTYGHSWGLLTGKTAESVVNQLETWQKFEKRWEKWAGTDFGPETYFNPLGPIAVVKSDKPKLLTALDAADNLVSKFQDLQESYDKIMDTVEKDPKDYNPFTNVGAVLKEYTDNFKHTQQKFAELKQKLAVGDMAMREFNSNLNSLSQEMRGVEQHENKLTSLLYAGNVTGDLRPIHFTYDDIDPTFTDVDGSHCHDIHSTDYDFAINKGVLRIDMVDAISHLGDPDHVYSSNRPSSELRKYSSFVPISLIDRASIKVEEEGGSDTYQPMMYEVEAKFKDSRDDSTYSSGSIRATSGNPQIFFPNTTHQHIGALNLLMDKADAYSVADALRHLSVGTQYSTGPLPLQSHSPTVFKPQQRNAPVLTPQPIRKVPVLSPDAINTAINKASMADIKRLVAANPLVLQAKNQEGQTPLDYAVQTNGPLVSYLLSKGASPNVHDKQGRTPLHLANFGDPTIVQALVAHGADIDAVDKEGRTPLFFAAFHDGDSATAIKFLIEHGAHANILDKYGCEAWQYALATGHDDALRVLQSPDTVEYATSGIPRKADMALREAAASHNLKLIAFTPTGGWVLAGRSGLTTKPVIQFDAIPQSLSTRLLALKFPWQISAIAFRPNGNWSIFTHEERYMHLYDQVDPKVYDVIDQMVSGDTLDLIAYTPEGGYIVIYLDKDGNQHARPNAIPDAAYNQICALYKSTQPKIKSVTFGPNHSWVILWDKNGAAWDKIPEAAASKLKALMQTGKSIDVVSLAPNGGWVVIGGLQRDQP